jgi:cell division inhibitor SepF
VASMWKRAMLYLGLGPDDEYDDYDDGQVPMAPTPVRHAPPPPEPPPVEPSTGAVRTLQREPGDGAVAARPRGVVRPITPVAPVKVVTIAPSGFNDAQEIGDKFKAGQPVIVNTQGLDVDLRRRLIDFTSGLCYGLGGQMERVANQVYLLTPSNVEVPAEEKRRLQERGLIQA